LRKVMSDEEFKKFDKIKRRARQLSLLRLILILSFVFILIAILYILFPKITPIILLILLAISVVGTILRRRDRLKSWISKNIIEDKFWFLFCLMIISILSIILPFPKLITIPIPEKSIDLFLGVNATIIATVLAIFFSISLSIIQHAANRYTSSILDDFQKDKKTGSVLILFVITVLLNLFVLFTGYRGEWAIVCGVLVIFCFVFLIIQFWRISHLINPINIVELMESYGIKASGCK